ncbi:extracellular solute-binding protein [Salipaludibacillus neizhouensis]|uniref:extracellular solute-binding protein n=1 Tax=Salipaludibacillus neizhouensis TaxID=885475 RepID=UPI001CBA68FB|nr:extracellular solute-binding protein [Salipaludibacillus neizhouensis]
MRKKLFILLLTVLMVAVLAVGCSSGEEIGQNYNGTNNDSSEGETGEEEIVDIEVWSVNEGFKEIDSGSPLYEFIVDEIGVGVISPYVEWNGGKGYTNQLNMRIAAGEMPDMFLPYNGIEYDLAKNGAIEDLTDLLPEYAPNLWELIPDEVWDTVRTNDPTGEGRIYYIPAIRDYGITGGMIRQDWIDKLGLEMPTTQEEYVDVLRAFKNEDPNGNGMQDEIPTGGRENGRWMDHLFAMYGIAMFEGFPDWDIYDGELTNSAVTQNMRDALEFISELYAEGLIDQETFLNDKQAWDGKINSGLVGSYFHWTETVYDRLPQIEAGTGVKADLPVLPVPKVPGYEGFYSHEPTLGPQWVVKSGMEEEKLMATMKFLDNYANQENWEDMYYGVEGMHHKIIDGKRVLLPEDKSTQQVMDVIKAYNHFSLIDFKSNLLMEAVGEEQMEYVEQGIRNMEENQKYVKVIAGNGMPESVYNDYPDIRSNMIYQEYATKIILGEYPIEKFDEFVDRWYETGGEEVTQRARDWYDKLEK